MILYQQDTLNAFVGQNKFGTLADWAMILVTIVTAYFLYKTLNSQIKVQKAQEELLKIERYKHFESIKPEFRVSGSDQLRFNWRQGTDGQYRWYGGISPIVIQTKKHRAKKIEVSISYVKGREDPVFLPSISEDVADEGKEINVPTIEIAAASNNPTFAFKLDLTIQFYDDALENKYFQKFTFSKPNNVHGGRLKEDEIKPYNIIEE